MPLNVIIFIKIFNVVIREKWLREVGSPKSRIDNFTKKNEREIPKLEF